MTLPQDILDRVERVLEYHRQSKYVADQIVAAPDRTAEPTPFRTFADAPRVALPTTLLNASVSTIALLQQGRDAVPDSQQAPPQDLKTLATWLFMCDGMIPILRERRTVGWLRTCPSCASTNPFELYVAALAVEGLDSGLYHYHPREFALRKLRDGAQTLSLLKRGRPDLDFVKDCPAVLLVSTIFSRSSWLFAGRGYRAAVADAGKLIENARVSASGLGIQTVTRLMVSDSNMRELIGVAPDCGYAHAEAVQGMLIWGDKAQHPIQVHAGANEHLPPIARAPLAERVTEYQSIMQVHHDCAGPGVAVREIRPPVTEMYPLPRDVEMEDQIGGDEFDRTRSLFKTLATRRPAPNFDRRAIPRGEFLAINRLALRGGTYFPIFPDGQHVGLVRPFWIVHDVLGFDSGVWYYHPPTDKWAKLQPNEFRIEAQYLSLENPLAGDGSAVCVLCADLGVVMRLAGPDLYRLAHLEAGIVAQRMHLAANALGLSARAISAFYDDAWRQFLGFEGTGWEPLHEVIIGVSRDDLANPEDNLTEPSRDTSWAWRD